MVQSSPSRLLLLAALRSATASVPKICVSPRLHGSRALSAGQSAHSQAGTLQEDQEPGLSSPVNDLGDLQHKPKGLSGNMMLQARSIKPCCSNNGWRCGSTSRLMKQMPCGCPAVLNSDHHAVDREWGLPVGTEIDGGREGRQGISAGASRGAMAIGQRGRP